MITYKKATKNQEKINVVETVFLEGKRVGRIIKFGFGFAYMPNGANKGETFNNISDVKKSLEEE